LTFKLGTDKDKGSVEEMTPDASIPVIHGPEEEMTSDRSIPDIHGADGEINNNSKSIIGNTLRKN